jgi:uncharacterized membrane protein YdbT with pleckstrin-like domain
MEQQLPKQDFSITLNKINPNEKVVAVIKRHPFGIIKLYISAVLGLILAGGLLLFVMSDLVPREDNPDIYAAVGALAVVVVGFMIVIMLLATIIYYKSSFVITDQSIKQTLQISLFNKKISQLNVAEIQDVTAQKKGVLPTFLNYGRLLVETAGEQENFHFDYCPNPDHYAKIILDSRQLYLSGHELKMQSPQPQQPQAPQQQYAQPQYEAPQQPQAPQQQYAQPQYEAPQQPQDPNQYQ